VLGFVVVLVVVGVGVVVVAMVGDDDDDDDAERVASKSSDAFEGAGDGKAVYAIMSMLVVGLVSATTAVAAGCACAPPSNIGRPWAARALTTAPHPSSKVRIRSFSASFSRSLSRSLSGRA